MLIFLVAPENAVHLKLAHWATFYLVVDLLLTQQLALILQLLGALAHFRQSQAAQLLRLFQHLQQVHLTL